MNARPVTSAAVNPATFHLDCVDHLYLLECDLTGLGDRAGEGPSGAKLRIIRKLLDDIRNFSEPRFSELRFNSFDGRSQKMSIDTEYLEQLLTNASWSSVTRLFGYRPERDMNGEIYRLYAQLRRDFKLFLIEYFAVCVKRSRAASDEKRAFLESVDTFISEVDRSWN